MKKHMNIPIFIPHEGCPNDCIFCNQRKISGSVHTPSESEMDAIIRKHLESPALEREIAFFGGSFTGLPVSEQEKYLQIAEKYVQQGRVKGIRLSTRPDYISSDILKLLGKYSVTTIELGIQSLNEEVLFNSKRFYSPETAIQACKLIQLHGFSLGVQMMIGLPGDSLEKSLMTAKKLIALGPNMVRVYPTLVIRETELESAYKSGRYKPMSLEEAVFWCSQIIPLFDDANISVLRVGLQHTDDLQKGVEVVAGPQHPAFGELVYSEIWYSRIVKEIDKGPEKPGKHMTIHVSASEVSKVIGQHQKNLKQLKNKYGFTSIKVLGDQDTLNQPILEFYE